MDQTLRLSQFLVRVREEGFVAAYCTATGNYLVLSHDEQKVVETTTGTLPYAPRLDRLVRYGMLIPADVDQVASFKAVYGASRGSGVPALVVAPTLDCNFACSYCWEDHVRGAMSENVRSGVVRFARSLAYQAHGRSALRVTWFGGEPLMALNVIRTLTADFQRLSQQTEDGGARIYSGYHANIITNGFGLTPAVCSEFEALAITDMQVTLDGSAEYHDRRRFLKGSGRPTFDRILGMLKLMPSSVSLTVRMNVDKDNVGGAIPLFHALEREGLFRRDGGIQVDLHQVEDYTPRAKVSDRLFTPEAFSSWWMDAREEALRRGWPLAIRLPRPALQGVCQVDNPLGFVVHPDGTLYRCYVELGNAGHPVGSVVDESSWQRLGWAPFQVRDPFDDPECNTCALLPTCMGSCPLMRGINRSLRVKQCPPYKSHFDRLVAARYKNESRLVRDMTPPPADADANAAIHGASPG